MIQKVLAILVVIFLFTIQFYGQIIEDPILAQVGQLTITKSEFENRLNFSPKIGIQDKNNSDGIKKEMLYTMIAEKLWANEAFETGFENNTYVRTARNVIEKMFVRDELYRKEIKDKINITQESTREAEDRYTEQLHVLIFFTETEIEIRKLGNLLANSQSIEVVLNQIDSNVIFQKELTLSYGDLEKETEDIIYNLKSNQFSIPIEMEAGWNIFYLNNFSERIISSPKESRESSKFIMKILKKREEQNHYDKFHHGFFNDKKVDVDGKLFKLIVNELHNLFIEKENENILLADQITEQKIVFDTYHLKKLKTNLGDEILSMEFIKLYPSPIDVETFLQEISFSSFILPSSDIDSIKIYLNKKLKGYIKYELLAREGYKQGLHSSADVVKWVKIWHENFLYQAVKNNLLNNNSDLNIKGIDSDIELAKKEFNNKNQFQKFIDSTIQLSEKYGYQVNDKIFSKVKLGNINFFVMRNLGFGGSIAGVPSSLPFMQWYVKEQNNIKENL